MVRRMKIQDLKAIQNRSSYMKVFLLPNNDLNLTVCYNNQCSLVKKKFREQFTGVNIKTYSLETFNNKNYLHRIVKLKTKFKQINFRLKHVHFPKILKCRIIRKTN